MGLVNQVIHFINSLVPSHIVEIGEARKFTFLVLIDNDEYYSACLIDYPERYVFKSRDLFKLWEISDNMSQTVQGR